MKVILNPTKLRYSHIFQRESWKRSMYLRHMIDTIIMVGIVALFNIFIISFVAGFVVA